MTPADLTIAVMLALVDQLGPFRGVKCTPVQIEQMQQVIRADPLLPTQGMFRLVKQTCKRKGK